MENTAAPAPTQIGDAGGLLSLQPGRITEVTGRAGMGVTRLGLGFLAVPARRSPVVAIDVKGWLSPLAAWEAGVPPGRLVVVRCPDPAKWLRVTAALLEGAGVVYSEVPATVRDGELRRLAALARARRTGVVFRPLGDDLPAGVAHLRLRVTEVIWEGVDHGHGRLGRRRLTVEAAGRAMAGIPRMVEVVDDGTDTLRVVPRVGTPNGDLAATAG